MNSFRPIILAVTLIGSALLAQTADAQNEAPPTPRTAREIRIAPVAMAKPVLAHPLLPEVTELEPGDASPLYLTACLLSAQARAKAGDAAAARIDLVEQLLFMPGSELPRDKGRELIEPYRTALEQLDAAARRESCRWELPAKGRGFDTALPHLPELSFLLRVLALDARLCALDGRHETALRRVRTGMAIARHLAEQPTLVQANLAAFGVDWHLLAVEDLAASSRSPNLYGSLASLPNPLVDPRGVARWERSMLELTAPGIERAATGRLTPQQWDEIVTRLRDAKILTDSRDGGGWDASIAGAMSAARSYALAKRDLAARPAFESTSPLDDLPIDYVIGVWQYLRYRDWTDEVWSAFQLPLPEAYARLEKAQAAIQGLSDREGYNPFLALVPRVEWARFRLGLGDRHAALMQAVEALRDYAASHDGRLPTSIGGVDGLLPSPKDPSTGEAFAYAVDADRRSATIRLVAPAGVPAREDSYRISVVTTP